MSENKLEKIRQHIENTVGLHKFLDNFLANFKRECKREERERNKWLKKQSSKPQKPWTGKAFQARFTYAKKQARERSIKWTLTDKQYYQLVEKALCSYCGYPLAGKGVELDRINSKGIYETNNVTPCCGLCNMTKARDKFSYREMLDHIGPSISKVKYLRDKK